MTTKIAKERSLANGRKMGRPRTGSVRGSGDGHCWARRIKHADGVVRDVDMGSGYSPDDPAHVAAAQARALEVQAALLNQTTARRETVREWCTRWFAHLK